MSGKVVLSQTPANTARPWVRDSVSRGLLVYSAAFAGYSLHLSPTHGWMAQAELTWVAGSALRWFTRLKTVIHLGTKWAQHIVTTLIQTSVLL